MSYGKALFATGGELLQMRADMNDQEKKDKELDQKLRFFHNDLRRTINYHSQKLNTDAVTMCKITIEFLDEIIKENEAVDAVRNKNKDKK